MSGDIVFTDRYGGRPPSALRACHACDAMGYVPVPIGDPTDVDTVWTFELCEHCLGSAKVSYWQSIRRFPRWLVSGLRFTIRERKFAGIRASFRAGILADLGLWRP